MIVGIQSEIMKIASLGLLEGLLLDRTTKEPIIWATDAYREKGILYERHQPMTVPLITNENEGIIKTRAQKEMEHQSERTKTHAEVFTPLWICRMMNDQADAGWFRKDDPHPFESEQPLRFLKRHKWQHYVDARLLEITCGEAPYLVSRYDAATGEPIPMAQRTGLLDRKLRVVDENAPDEDTWMTWTKRAFQATYGYEFQGDNVLLARLNLLMTFEEHVAARWQRSPTVEEYQAMIHIITWNIWQMDGLNGTQPYGEAETQQHMFDTPTTLTKPLCQVMDWRGKRKYEFIHAREGDRKMKFDFVVGNAGVIYGLIPRKGCNIKEFTA